MERRIDSAHSLDVDMGRQTCSNAYCIRVSHRERRLPRPDRRLRRVIQTRLSLSRDLRPRLGPYRLQRVLEEVPSGRGFSLNMHDHSLRHLAAAEGKHEHDMGGMEPLKPKGLRQTVAKGKRVLQRTTES